MAGQRRRWMLVGIVGALSVTMLLGGGSLRRATAGVSEIRLPDLDQELPTQVSARAVGGGFQLGFDSGVVNKGPGPLRVSAVRVPGGDFMVADQMVQGSGGWARIPGVGRLEYVDSFGHEHWHYMQFQRYELYSSSDPGRILGDRKQGFCLADAYAPGWCGQGEPDRTAIEVGLSVGANDRYKKFVEGQEIVIDRATTPSGRYVLVNRTDAPRDGAATPLQEVTLANNAASLLIELSWPSADDRAPGVRVVQKCPDTWDCPPGSGRPGALGAPPVAPPAAPLPVAAAPVRAARLRRAGAGVLARRALRREFTNGPLAPRLLCARRTASRFACRAVWRRAGAAYRVRLVVWKGTHGSYYRMRALRRQAGCATTAARCARSFRRAGRLTDGRAHEE